MNQAETIGRPADYVVKDPNESELSASVVDMAEPPRVSFCIPTLNDVETLEYSLRRIRAQDYPDIEIVVVDGGSDDGTIEIAQAYADMVKTDDGLLGSARATGVQESTGEILALFDGDIYLPHDRWLHRAVAQFNFADDVSTVWPRNVAPPNAPPLTRLYFAHWDRIMNHRIASGKGYVGGGNALFRRDYLNSIGGISRDLHWGEDFDWARRLAEAGYRVVYHTDPIQHDTMRSLHTFAMKQLLGAETFTRTGFGLMGLSLTDVVYEQYALGLTGMATGLLRDREPAWLLYPPYIAIRTAAYGIGHIQRLLGDS